MRSGALSYFIEGELEAEPGGLSGYGYLPGFMPVRALLHVTGASGRGTISKARSQPEMVAPFCYTVTSSVRWMKLSCQPSGSLLPHPVDAVGKVRICLLSGGLGELLHPSVCQQGRVAGGRCRWCPF